MLSLRHRKHISNGSVLFLFIGLVVTVVLAAVVFSQSDNQRTAVGEFPSLKPDIASVLPSGAVFDEAAVAEVRRGPSASSVFVVAFTRQRESSVGVVAWDAAKGKYILSSYAPLVEGDARVLGVPEMAVAGVGSRLPSVAFAKGPTGVSRETTFVLVVDNTTVAVAELREAGSLAGRAVFSEGPLLQWSEKPTLEDLNSDGAFELVVTSRGKGETGEPIARKRAYAWKDSAFVLDDDLTWALDMTTRLFPEAPNGLVP